VAVVVVDPQGVPSRVQIRERPAYEASAPAKRGKAKRVTRSFPQRDWPSQRRKKLRFNPYTGGARPWSHR